MIIIKSIFIRNRSRERLRINWEILELGNWEIFYASPE
jgi:hypothetical protein